MEGDPNFTLMPFDEVHVRKSPSYYKQENVTVEGEVLYGGTYALTMKNQRLSELVANAGGLTPQANVKGARLERKMTAEEMLQLESTIEAAIQMAENKSDSVAIRRRMMNQTTYSVGIELDKALEEPGTDADVVLRDGDKLIVPQYSNTVKVSGDVMYAYMDVIAEEGDVLKAGTPVIVKAEEGSYNLAITMDDTNAKGALEGSLLKGNFISQTLTQGGDYKKFIFADGNNGVGFYLLSDDDSSTIGANKCWMEWNVSAGQPEVRSFVISFDDATGISDIIPETKENSTHLIYNVGGQRLNKPQKGLNIVNGKKMIY